MKIGVLTSSRADFGIYLPLLKKLAGEPLIELEIIAFGTHLSHFHGYTVGAIEDQGFEVRYRIESLVLGDTEEAISASIGLTVLKFSSFWEQQRSYDIVFCLGDRYEMLAAVLSGVPFNIKFAHIHGGETTLGAMDNVFRHAMTHAARMHFTSTEQHAIRVKEMTNSAEVYNVGSLSLDNIDQMELYNDADFWEKWRIDLAVPSILVTFHPETVDTGVNEEYAKELCSALEILRGKYQIIITMPNADTQGSLVRSIIKQYFEETEKVYLIENFGTKAYFTVMKRSSFLIGNSSSGIIEAASFNKYVLNIGDRQKGRMAGGNVFDIPVLSDEIVGAAKIIEGLPIWNNGNLYSNGNAAEQILRIIKGNEL